MAQEQTELQTQNSGGFFAGLGNFVNTLATPAANLYTLKLQGDLLKQQSAGQATVATANANAATANATAAQMSAQTKQWLIWGAVAVGLVVVLALVFRRR